MPGHGNPHGPHVAVNPAFTINGSSNERRAQPGTDGHERHRVKAG
jgi:hypothetical protein